jgi:hypothetical protein
MKIPEVYKLLKLFTELDFREFEKYLQSPLLNTNKSLLTVFRLINNNKSLIAQNEYSKLRNLLKRRTGFSAATIRKLLSFLSNVVLNYYKYKSVLSDDIYANILLNQTLLKNGSYETLTKSQISLSNTLSGLTKFNADNLYNTYLHATNLLNTSVIRLKYQSKNESKYRIDVIAQSSENLIVYTLIKLTNDFINYILTSVDSGKEKEELKFFIELDKIFEATKHSIGNSSNEIGLVFQLYYNAFLCYNNLTKKEYYLKYKRFFEGNIEAFDGDTINANINILLSYCIICQRITDEDKFFYSEELVLMSIYIDQELYKNEITSYLSSIMYRNYVLLCFDIMDMEVLKRFIDGNSINLKSSERPDLTNFALAHYYFGIKNIQKSLKHLNSLDLNRFVYKYDILNIEIKIYFERSDLISIEKIFHNYRELIKKDNLLTKYDKRRFMVFFKYFQELLRIISKPDSNNTKVYLKFLREKIENQNTFVMKKWILSKINERCNSKSAIIR